MAQKISHHNYTIPIAEAFDAGGECPLCDMRGALEKNALEYVLGPSYMEDGVRARTDKAGFCKAHYAAMFRMGNRLGLGLIVQTHARRLIDGAEALLEGGPPAKKIGLFGNAEAPGRGVGAEIGKLADTSGTCFVCGRVNAEFARFVSNTVLLWQKQPPFREKFARSKGFCLPHFALLLEVAEKELNAADYAEFYGRLAGLERENLERLKSELAWFIRKFDYQNAGEPWRGSADALERMIEKIASACLVSHPAGY